MRDLTPREAQILNLLCEGKRDKEIGRALGLSDTTVRGEIRLICARLDVPNRYAAVAKWTEKKRG